MNKFDLLCIVILLGLINILGFNYTPTRNTNMTNSARKQSQVDKILMAYFDPSKAGNINWKRYAGWEPDEEYVIGMKGGDLSFDFQNEDDDFNLGFIGWNDKGPLLSSLLKAWSDEHPEEQITQDVYNNLKTMAYNAVNQKRAKINPASWFGGNSQRDNIATGAGGKNLKYAYDNLPAFNDNAFLKAHDLDPNKGFYENIAFNGGNPWDTDLDAVDAVNRNLNNIARDAQRYLPSQQATGNQQTVWPRGKPKDDNDFSSIRYLTAGRRGEHL